MRNFIQEGCAIDVASTPSGGYTSGNFYMYGAIGGVAAIDSLETEANVLHTEGVFELPKATGAAWTLGQPLYWDTGNSEFTGTNAAECIPMGVAALAAGSSDATGYVKLGDCSLRMVCGETALDGGNPTPVVTGLSAIAAAAVCLKSASAPGVGTSVVTYGSSDGTLNLYGWKVTATDDATLIASTGTETVGWVAWGY